MVALTPLFSMRRAVEDPNLLGSMLEGASWDVWRTLLIASRGEALKPDEIALFQQRTGRTTAPATPVSEAAFVCGRRSGKTVSAATLAVYYATMFDWRKVLTIGERGVFLFLAQSQRTARVAFNYASGLFDQVPMLGKLVENRTADTISLNNGVDLEIRPASFRGLRGVTAIGCIADEVAFWFNDDSANPDVEILASIRPALITTGGPLVMISSPYAKRGELYRVYQKHFAVDGSPVLVAQGASRDFNKTLPQRIVDEALEQDPERYSAEYLAQFRDDVSGFITRAAVLECVEGGLRERPPDRLKTYLGFIDPSGGSADSMTLAIAHKEGETAILDAVREVKPPFSPEAVVLEFAALLRTYRVSQVIGDKYAGEWCQEAFRRAGIYYEPSAMPKSDLYRDLLPLINSRACDLLDNDRVVHQLVSLERRTGRSGRDTIDHPPGGHDDLANGVAGALTLAVKGLASDPVREAAWSEAADRARERLTRCIV